MNYNISSTYSQGIIAQGFDPELAQLAANMYRYVEARVSEVGISIRCQDGGYQRSLTLSLNYLDVYVSYTFGNMEMFNDWGFNSDSYLGSVVLELVTKLSRMVFMREEGR